ncbi:MAG: hypothetical protein H7315_00860 [Herminiimonas sp.]|nr:hypothetical protein [Herminiimonas sp.]
MLAQRADRQVQSRHTTAKETFFKIAGPPEETCNPLDQTRAHCLSMIGSASQGERSQANKQNCQCEYEVVFAKMRDQLVLTKII